MFVNFCFDETSVKFANRAEDEDCNITRQNRNLQTGTQSTITEILIRKSLPTRKQL